MRTLGVVECDILPNTIAQFLHAIVSDGPVNHQYDFDTLATDGDELKFHLVAKDGYVRTNGSQRRI